jgi:hypothetical protein
MNHPETVDPGIARFLFDHGVYYILPAGETVSIAKAVREHVVMNSPDRVAGTCHGESFNGVGFQPVRFKEGVVMSQVTSRGRRTSLFIPYAVGLFHFGERELGREFVQTTVALLEYFGQGGGNIVVGAEVGVIGRTVRAFENGFDSRSCALPVEEVGQWWLSKVGRLGLTEMLTVSDEKFFLDLRGFRDSEAFSGLVGLQGSAERD